MQGGNRYPLRPVDIGELAIEFTFNPFPVIGIQPIPFIQCDDQRPALGQHVTQQRRVLISQPFARIEHQDHNMSPVNRLQCLDRAELLNNSGYF